MPHQSPHYHLNGNRDRNLQRSKTIICCASWSKTLPSPKWTGKTWCKTKMLSTFHAHWHPKYKHTFNAGFYSALRFLILCRYGILDTTRDDVCLFCIKIQPDDCREVLFLRVKATLPNPQEAELHEKCFQNAHHSFSIYLFIVNFCKSEAHWYAVVVVLSFTTEPPLVLCGIPLQKPLFG